MCQIVTNRQVVLNLLFIKEMALLLALWRSRHTLKKNAAMCCRNQL